MREGWETPHPHAVAESLGVLHFYQDNPVDAVWHHLVEYDVAQVEKSRNRMKAFLARYGRQSMLQWDDVEVGEMRELALELRELVDEEHELQRVTEND